MISSAYHRRVIYLTCEHTTHALVHVITLPPSCCCGQLVSRSPLPSPDLPLPGELDRMNLTTASLDLLPVNLPTCSSVLWRNLLPGPLWSCVLLYACKTWSDLNPMETPHTRIIHTTLCLLPVCDLTYLPLVELYYPTWTAVPMPTFLFGLACPSHLRLLVSSLPPVLPMPSPTSPQPAAFFCRFCLLDLLNWLVGQHYLPAMLWGEPMPLQHLPPQLLPAVETDLLVLAYLPVL